MDERLLDELYGAPLDRFVAVRDELCARLREAGDRASAEHVKALRKPSVPAWAVNQLARVQAGTIAELVAVGERLAAAQAGVLAGEDPTTLHAARADERAVVARLVASAEELLADAGFAPNLDRRERVANTLYAMAAQPQARAAIVAGRLTEELERVGFGEAVPLDAVPAPRARPPATAGERPDAATLRATARDAVASAVGARETASRLSEEAAQAEADAEHARRRANDARREAERAARDADRAEARAKAAAAALAEALGDGADKHDILAPEQGA